MAWNIVSTWSKQVRFFHVFEVQRPAGLGTQRTKNPKKIETNFYAIWLDIELK